jgi:hypothetical protein
MVELVTTSPTSTIPAKKPYWEYAHDARLSKSADRKSRLLKAVDKQVRKSLRLGEFQYPDIIKLAKDCSIHYSVLSSWIKSDKEFAENLERIEGLAIQDCRKIVYNAKNKAPYLAMQLLQARAPEFQREIKHSGTFAHFHIVSNVRSNGKITRPGPAESVFAGVEEAKIIPETEIVGAAV